VRLTQRRIETLGCPTGKKDILVFDDDQKGLGVRVTSGGGKFFLAQYRIAGVKRRVPLGACSAISLAHAREAARAIMGDAAKGRDHALERKEAIRAAKARADREVLTLRVLIDKWETEHLADKRPGYKAEATRALRFGFAKHLCAPAAALEAEVVAKIVKGFARAGRAAMAKQTAAYGRACFTWATAERLVTTNPFRGLRLKAVPSRERVISDDELRSVWRATAGASPYNAIVRMLVLTGQRREEVAAMTWDELADDLSAWTIPGYRAKNGKDHIVPLSPQAQAILRAMPRIEGSDLAFPGRGRVFNSFSKAKNDLDAVSGVKGWRLHDLRRTVATGLQRLGVRLEVTEAVLNHVSGSRAGIVGVYQRHSWADEKRAALCSWGAHVEGIVAGRSIGKNLTNLVPLTRRA
jgi:integrase